MADLETFRADIAQWLDDNAPQSIRGLPASELTGTWGGKKETYDNPDWKVWLDVASEKGLTAPTWPSAGATRGSPSCTTKPPMAKGSRPRRARS